LSKTRDLFFDEFYEELERVASGIQEEGEETPTPPVLAEEARRRWHPYAPDPEERGEALVAVDGGVQVSSFAYGGFVAVGRALALTHRPGRDRAVEKRVKIHVQEVYDDRDRGFIPGYVRMIAEYDAATKAAQRVLEEGGKPLVVLDGSLYLARFPYATREYSHHPELLRELFASMSRLRALGRDEGFTVAAVSKDSTVFYLYMQLLKEAVRRAGLGRFIEEIDKASSPLDLRMKAERWPQEDRDALKPFTEAQPLCDTALIRACTETEGYTHPLLLAPSIYYGRGDPPALYGRIERTLGKERAGGVINSIESFFNCPGVAMTCWKPAPGARPFRVDVSASALGLDQPWEEMKRNKFAPEDLDPSPLERVFNHLGHWYCNEVEYNIPMRQADMLARFDRDLYARKYEPFIISRLEGAGYDITGRRRVLREVG